MTTDPIVMRCTEAGSCDAHRLGDAKPHEKCPGMCDAPGCDEDVTGDEFCTGHAALDEAGATPEEMALASRKADRYGVSLARLLFDAVKMVPFEEEATPRRFKAFIRS